MVFRNKSVSPQLDELEPPADSPHPLEAEQEDTLPEASWQQVGDHHSRSCLSTALDASALTVDFSGGLCGAGTSELENVQEQYDTWCPTCSSSSDSDSEPEGFFFGTPIPKPGSRHLAFPTAEQQALGGGGRAARARASSKHCTVS